MLLKVYNLWRQLAKPSQIDHSAKKGFLPYGHGANGGNFPLRLADLVKRSPTASACISTKADYVKGEGISNKDLEDFKINSRGQTFLSLHDTTSDSITFIDGFAWNIKYNLAGKITEIYPMPFENFRLCKPDDKGYISKIHYNPFFGTDLYSEKDTIIYDCYNPDPKVVQAQIKDQGEKYHGQVLYYGHTGPLNRFYPEPSYYSAKDSIESDRRISEYNKENLAGGMLQSFMLIMKGNPDDPTKNPNYQNYQDDAGNTRPMTKGEEFDLLIGDTFMGSERVANMFVQWVDNSEEKPEILPFPGFVNDSMINSIKAQVIKDITIATKVPAVLANIHEGVSLGGDGNMIRAAVKLMQQRAKPVQRTLLEIYKEVLSHFYKSVDTDFEIKPYNPFPEIQAIDPNIWGTLTTPEKRNWISKNTEIELMEDQPISTGSNQLPDSDQEPDATSSGDFVNVSYTAAQIELFKASLHTDYPEGARSNAKRAIEWMEKTGIKCAKKFGLELGKKISEGNPISFTEMKRIYKYLVKNEQLLNSPFDKGCLGVEINLWGGEKMLNWLNERIPEVLK